MLKAADALHAAGYEVRVVSARHTPWATEADQSVRARRNWSWTPVDCSRDSARALQIASGARRRLAAAVSRRLGAGKTPMPIVTRAFSRLHDELVDAILVEPADLVYAGTTGALAAAAEAASRLNVPYGLDLEDFHSGEHSEGRDNVNNVLAERIEREVLSKAAFLTAGSPMIADAYAAKYHVRPTPIHNTFTLQFGPMRTMRGDEPPRLYWFSQTLGAGRGLDEVVRAVGIAGIAAELHLRARPDPDYTANLLSLQAAKAPSLKVVVHEPGAPDDMVPLAHGYDLGLSCEEPDVLNRKLCLGNKVFTYLAAGIPVVLSNTPAQACLAEALGPAALVYPSGEPDSLAAVLRAWLGDPERRFTSWIAARSAAERRWHWEHPEDRGVLLRLTTSIVGAAA
jgi:glycosyltransferase involved in cell wall biosynthesis